MLAKIFAVSVILTVISIGVSVFYYFVVYTPKHNKEVLEFKKNQSEQLGVCMKEAESRYHQFWDRECNGLGFRANCRLAKELSDRVDGQLEGDKADCYRRYQVEKTK